MSKPNDKTKTEPEQPRTDEQEMMVIEQLLFPAAMAGAVGIEQTSPTGIRLYLDRIAASAEKPGDPIETMMLHQLALAHHRIAQLHTDSAGAKTVDAMAIYGAAATRLTAEFRRLAVALKQYRGPAKSTTVVHRIEQVNLATTQEVRYAKDEAGGRVSMQTRDSEVTSNKTEKQDHEHDLHEQRRRREESQACGGRAAQPAQAGAAD